MKVVSVDFDNYGAFYGQHSFQVSDRGLVLILGENKDEPRMNSNGSAKSTLLESIDWCLFGEVPKGDHADSVINDEEKSCSVTTHLIDDDGTPGKVTRGRPNRLLFEVGGEDCCGLDTKETQKRLEAWLGMDRDVFHAAVFFGQNDMRHFADSTDAQRMAILSRIIPELGEVDRLLELAKESQKKIEIHLTNAKTQATTKEGEIRALESMDYQSQIDGWENKRRGDVEILEVNLRDIQQRRSAKGDSSSTVTHLESQVAQMRAQVLPTAPIMTPEKQQADADMEAVNAEVATTGAEVQRLQGEAQRIVETGEGRCFACGTIITAEHAKVELDRIGGEITVAQSCEQVARSKLQAAAANRNRARGELAREAAHANQMVREHANQLATVQGDLDRAKASFREEAALDVEINRAQQSIQIKQMELNPFEAQAVQMQDRLRQLMSEYQVDKAKVDGFEVDVGTAQFWVEAFGPRGVKSYILDTKLQELTDAANEWVKLLTGGTFWVRFESQKQGRTTKTLRNAPSIRVFKYQPDGRVSERNYSSWSGGEKQRISWCIDFGLSRLVARRAAKRWDLLALDEVFKYVDAAGGAAVVEMLTQLQREKSSIFVIEHDGEFQSHFETVVTVRKERGRSRILESGYGNQKEDFKEISTGVVAGRPKLPKRRPPRRRAAIVKKEGGQNRESTEVEPTVKPQKNPPKRRPVRRRAAIRRETTN